MIRYIYDPESGAMETTASGTATDIAAELGLLIGTSHNLIRSRNPQEAENLRMRLMAVMLPGSPIWDRQDVPDPSVGIKIVQVTRRKEQNHE